MKFEEYLKLYFDRQILKEWALNPVLVDLNQFKNCGSFCLEDLYSMIDEFGVNYNLTCSGVMKVYCDRVDTTYGLRPKFKYWSEALIKTCACIAAKKIISDEKNQKEQYENKKKIDKTQLIMGLEEYLCGYFFIATLERWGKDPKSISLKLIENSYPIEGCFYDAINKFSIRNEVTIDSLYDRPPKTENWQSYLTRLCIEMAAKNIIKKYGDKP